MLSIMVPGALSSLQDLGVSGFLNSGFQQTGAADRDSLRKANILVNNPQDEAAVEMTLTGITAYFVSDCVIAVTGADIEPQLNWEAIPMYTAIAVKKGDTFSSGSMKNGCRAYLAVSGGFDIPKILGSKSTNLKLKSGGFEGRKLKAGDLLTFSNPQSKLAKMQNRKIQTEDISNSISLNVVMGPQEDYFTQKGINSFLASKYLVTPASDRMGIRLDGEKIEAKNGVDIISDGIACGSIQIPSNGQPIILGADRQTTGGYAKIATVISTDMRKVAQLKPGDSVNFKAISVKEAQKILAAYEKDMARLNKKING